VIPSSPDGLTAEEGGARTHAHTHTRALDIRLGGFRASWNVLSKRTISAAARSNLHPPVAQAVG